MEQRKFDIARLIVKFLRNDLSKEEAVLFEQWLAESGENRQILESFRQTNAVEEEINFLAALDVDAGWVTLRKKVERNRKGTQKRIIYYIGSAAAVVLLALTWIWLLPSGHTNKLAGEASQVYQHDVLPGGNKASLILSDGKQLDLTAGLDNVKEKDGTEIVGNKGELSYIRETGETKKATLIYNTLIVPKAGTYKLILPDGTKVWVNALSSLKFPLQFNGLERKVYLSGEAYFEVAKNAGKSFRVVVNGTEVEVLGTSFNVNGYTKITSTTLVDGAIKVLSNGKGKILVPGQQATVNGNDVQLQPADMLRAISWKNGDFYFKGDRLPDIMDQLARWYDLEIKYSGTIPDKRYNGNIARSAKLSEVLEMLKFFGDVQFIVDGRVLTVRFN